MNELIKIENANFDLVPFNAETAQTIAEELDGLDGFRFDEVKIPSGGSLAFELPSDDPDNPETATSITGIIAYHHSANARWEGNYTGDADSNAPVCISYDGVLGFNNGTCTECKECPFNQFGSDESGVGKACKNMKRVYILRSGELLPLVLVLPPTSIRPFREYLGRLVKRGKKPSGVITKITLKKEKSQSGIVYSRVALEKVAELSPDEQAAVAGIRKDLEAFLEAQTHLPQGEASEPAESSQSALTEPGEFTPF